MQLIVGKIFRFDLTRTKIGQITEHTIQLCSALLHIVKGGF
ncbi:Uncharacterised protein [Vibrio cholerae]|nr:Uncharacterised protein [Vibrio cholerae]